MCHAADQCQALATACDVADTAKLSPWREGIHWCLYKRIVPAPKTGEQRVRVRKLKLKQVGKALLRHSLLFSVCRDIKNTLTAQQLCKWFMAKRINFFLLFWQKKKKKIATVINCLIRENNSRFKYIQWYIEWEGQSPWGIRLKSSEGSWHRGRQDEWVGRLEYTTHVWWGEAGAWGAAAWHNHP